MINKKFSREDEENLDTAIQDIMDKRSLNEIYYFDYANSSEYFYFTLKDHRFMTFLKKREPYGSYLVSIEEISREPMAECIVCVYDPLIRTCDPDSLISEPVSLYTRSFKGDEGLENKSRASKFALTLVRSNSIREYMQEIGYKHAI